MAVGDDFQLDSSGLPITVGPDGLPTDAYEAARFGANPKPGQPPALVDELAHAGGGMSGPPSAVPGQSEGQSQSVEYRGMTPEGMKRSSGLFGQAEDKANAYTNQLRDEYSGLQKNYNQDYSTIAEANKAEATAHREHFENLTSIHQRELDFNQHAADLEQHAAAESRAAQQAHLATYQEQLAGVKQLMLQSGNPMSTLGGGEAFAMGAAQFAQGFLAARGINIDVSGQIDRWVERGMQQHQQMIQNMKGAADETLHLYEIARQTSQDAWEARQRYRGFMIEGFKSQIEMESSRYGSSVAEAHAKEQNAKLDIELQNTVRSLGDSFFTKSMESRKSFIDEAYKQGQLAIEQAKVGEDKRHHMALEANAKKKEAPDVRKYYDPTTKKVIGTITDKTVNSDKRAQSADEVTAAYKEIDPLMKRAAALHSKAAQIGILGEGWWKTNDPTAREFDQTVKEIAAARALAMSGKAVNEQEYERIRDLFPYEKSWQSGNNDQQVMNYMEDTRKGYEAKITTVTDAPSKDMEGETEQDRIANPALHQAYNASKNGGAPVKANVVQKNAADAAVGGRGDSSMQGRVDSWKAETKGNDPVAAHMTWKGFVDENPKAGSTWSGRKTEYNSPAYARHIDAVGQAYAEPEKFTKTGEDPAATKREAMAALERLAKDDLPGWRNEYASYVIRELKKDPSVFASNAAHLYGEPGWAEHENDLLGGPKAKLHSLPMTPQMRAAVSQQQAPDGVGNGADYSENEGGYQ